MSQGQSRKDRGDRDRWDKGRQRLIEMRAVDTELHCIRESRGRAEEEMQPWT